MPDVSVPDVMVRLPGGRVVEVRVMGDRGGQAVVLFGGTPSTAGFAQFLRQPAARAGVCIVCVSRPGYGGSSWVTPSLATVASDVASVADQLGLERFAVLGVSGGGPFAAATAAALGDRVTNLGLAAALSGWRGDPDRPDDRDFDRWADVAHAGDEPTAVARIVEPFASWLEGMVQGADDSMSVLFDDAEDADLYTPRFRQVFADDFRAVAASPHGYGFDRIAHRTWDVDLGDVVAPAGLWYGSHDHAVSLGHAQWYLERIPTAHLTVVMGRAHCAPFARWDEILAFLQTRA